MQPTRRHRDTEKTRTINIEVFGVDPQGPMFLTFSVPPCLREKQVLVLLLIFV